MSKKHSIEVNLRVANKKDFIQFAGHVKAKDSKGQYYIKKKYKTKFGMPYWCINSKGEIEKLNYIFSELTDINNFKKLLENNQILILNEHF